MRKILGYPFALIWDLITRIRNRLYDQEVFTSQEFDLPLIGVGNLTMGGSGKTPHVEYLLQILQQDYQLGVLSRGYKRKTNGYVLANSHTSVDEIGDEPLQYKIKYPHVAVAVCESRVIGIPQLLMDAPQTEVIILDDVFQHRAINPGLNILLTDYQLIYADDFVFPAGNLRESRSGAKRADLIIVTKCPANLSHTEAKSIKEKLKPEANQEVYFSTYFYGQPYSLFGADDLLQDVNQEVLLVTGIAKPEYLKSYLEDSYNDVYLMKFPDHYDFRADDIENIATAYNNLGDGKKIIMVTEKDAVKLVSHQKQIADLGLQIYIQPIQVEFLFEEQLLVNQEVLNFIENFYNESNPGTT